MLDELIKKIDAWTGKIELIIRDVGHGNWNEIRFSNTRICYDIGAQVRCTESQLDNLIRNSKIKGKDEIFIFLSH
ncbi:hypothetical protein [Bacillus marinisedimentorum]|uniref:hypothetical protein n=1 Tax=Bacillus marinisedimentorum TaxID=1821260 RepID=UPI0007E22D36|nr:hypothetical protein [Bacillus marinisedimentorum]